MSLKRRLAGNTITNVFALGLNALLQLVQVSALTSAWDLHKYGTWLMLSTIPIYFALSDLGFGSAAQSDMAMSWARGEVQATQRTYHSIWALLTCLSSSVCALGALVLFGGAELGVPLFQQYGLTMFLFLCYAALSMCSRVILAGFRATGHYAKGSLIIEIVQFSEGMAVVGMAVKYGSFNLCVATGIIMRCLSMTIMNLLLRHYNRPMAVGWTHAGMGEIRRLVKPAMAAMAMPMSLAINIQGIVLVVGYVLSPAAVAIINPVRTASRVVLQIVGALNRGAMPEISRAVSTGDRRSASRVVKANYYSLIFGLLPGALAFALLGQPVVAYWTHGKVVPDFTLVCLMAAAMLTQGMWYFRSMFLLAVSEHVSISRPLLLCAVCTLVIALPAGHFGGLNGIAAAILVGELLCLWQVSSRYGRSTLGQLLRAPAAAE